MEIVNTTAVPATLNVSSVTGRLERRGLVTVKLTFHRVGAGFELDIDAPIPILAKDEPTDLGLLPRDDIPRRDARCEVILLAAAHASRAPVDRMSVALAVGDVRRELVVFGDRRWVGSGSGAEPSRPAPFVRMPLVWERAFGGTATVLVDDESPLDLMDPRNPLGRGFDVRKPAEDLCREWKAPPGFPVIESARALPNVENPAALVTRWEDAPEPACWATAPPDVDLHLQRQAACFDQDNLPTAEQMQQPRTPYRAHPDWVIAPPGPGTLIRVDGVRPSGEPFAFVVPDLRVFADYVVGAHHGTRELRTETLVLLPEEQRFYLVLRHSFTVPYRPGEERAMRIRLERPAGGKKS